METRVNAIEAALPSGSEVASAAWHPRVAGCCPEHDGAGSGNWRTKLGELRSRSVSTMNQVKERSAVRATEIRRRATERAAMWKRSAAGTMAATGSAVRSRAQTGIAQMNSSMRNDPMKWAGIAAGSGVVLGLVGRLLDRQRHRRHLPQLVVIENA